MGIYKNLMVLRALCLLEESQSQKVPYFRIPLL